MSFLSELTNEVDLISIYFKRTKINVYKHLKLHFGYDIIVLICNINNI